jgi:hypothetical protein
MGDAPPPDYPPPEQDSVGASAGFAEGPPVASLCGFTIPSFIPKIEIKIPKLSFPPPLPTFLFSFSLGLSCDTSNPLDVSASTPFGGGRQSNAAPDPNNDPNFL